MSAAIARRIDELEERQQKLVEAHVYRHTISDDVYRREDGRLSEQIVLARIELHDAQLDDLDVEGMLNFAEHLILDARRLWSEANLDQQQRLQQALFPKGLTYSPATRFGTTETCLFYKWLAALPGQNSEEASPTGFEPVLPT